MAGYNWYCDNCGGEVVRFMSVSYECIECGKNYKVENGMNYNEV